MVRCGILSRIEQPNLIQQFVRTKRLEQTCLKTSFVYAICLFDQASDSDDRNTSCFGRPKFANLTQQLETIHSVHQNVRNHHMRTVLLDCVECLAIVWVRQTGHERSYRTL